MNIAFEIQTGRRAYVAGKPQHSLHTQEERAGWLQAALDDPESEMHTKVKRKTKRPRKLPSYFGHKIYQQAGVFHVIDPQGEQWLGSSNSLVYAKIKISRKLNLKKVFSRTATERGQV